MSTTGKQLSFKTLALWCGLILVLLAVGAVWIEAWYLYLERRAITSEVIEVPMPEREAHERAQRELLEGYRWIDRENGVVGLPIERAMELVASEKGARAR